MEIRICFVQLIKTPNRTRLHLDQLLLCKNNRFTGTAN